ncbi:exopolysaccharide biosynthesis polyprenyl glycosylphosphotransferase [Synechococcus sp. PCC 7502]|uniref:sugar transferase n=1 Tax=Synechococcus sp. PCC 7502 TaxID=1173263 RepID=UPI00029FAF57|nr:sugar transferase [Synechococcus sp. PCC 7502]AFY74248.1 exopolysaccharide biosynthesis polyprenyl glycosylphosphotransferase [Synechococcus sp. PCC 7502]
MRDLRASAHTQLVPTPEIGWFRAVTLLFGDLLGLALAWHLAAKLNESFQPLPAEYTLWEFLGTSSLFYFLTLVTILVLASQGFYSSTSQCQNYVKQAQLISFIYLASLVVNYFYDPKLDAPRSLFFAAWFASVGCVFVIRLLMILGIHQLAIARSQILVFIIAPASRIENLTKSIQRRPGYQVIGSTTSDQAYSSETIAKIIQLQAHEVLAEGLPETYLASELYWQLRNAQINLRLAPSSLAMLHRRGTPEIFAGMPTIKISSQFLGIWEYRCKRLLDFLGALLGIILLAPVFIVVAIAIKVSSPGGVFFSQERIGLNGKVFRMWKFRSMCINASDRQAELEKLNESQDGVMFKIKRDPRIIPIGHLIRRLSIDELPQLFNVLMGQMSLVGPRPLPIRDVALFADWHHIRHGVLPGITGLWQISGRSDLDTIDDAVRLDLHYIDHWSLNLDLAILVDTVSIVLFGKGAY